MSDYIARLEDLTPIFAGQGIMHFAPVAFSDCLPSNERLFAAAQGKGIRTAIMYLAPYFYRDAQRNISLYAVSEGYHEILGELTQGIIGDLAARYPVESFENFADHSPILEVDACIKGGLGFIGDNGLLIHPVAGSYSFIGGIYTTLDCEGSTPLGVSGCGSCGECKAACPVGLDKSRCLSYISQKKVLDEGDEEFLRENKCVWGCDICQEVCPHNSDLEQTEIEAFLVRRTPVLSQELLDGMSDEEFRRRGYAWRGKGTIARNLRIAFGTEAQSVMENKHSG